MAGWTPSPSRSAGSIPTSRCPATPTRATPAPTSSPGEDALLAAGGGRALVPTGIAIAIPAGWAGFVQPRSGLALRHGVTVLNSPGLIDAGYRDELKVVLVNTDPDDDYQVHRGDRIAQLVLRPVATATFEPVDELPTSHRDTGGFGSSGR